jgi:ParB/RepB/Spo0J family partition protein
MVEKKKSTRVSSVLSRMVADGTVPGFTPEDEDRPHKVDEPGVIWVEIGRIHDSPYQHSEQIDPDDFATLVASIATEGFQHALNVSPLEGQDGHFFLTAGGHQRRDAAHAAGVAKIPVFVAEAPERKRLAFRAAKENTARVNTALVNLGYLYLQIIEEFGVTQEEIADEIKRSREHVKWSIMAARSAPDIQEMLRAKPDSVRAMSYLRRLDNAEDRAPIIAQFLNGHITTDGVHAAVEEIVVRKGQSAPLATVEERSARPQSVPGTHVEEHSMTSAAVPSSPSHTRSPAARESEQGHQAYSGSSPQPAISEEHGQQVERIGQVKAMLSRFRSYGRLVESPAKLSDQERSILQEIMTLARQLLGQ